MSKRGARVWTRPFRHLGRGSFRGRPRIVTPSGKYNSGVDPLAARAAEDYHRLLRDDFTLRHVSRVESASPATGSATVHGQERAELLGKALADIPA